MSDTTANTTETTTTKSKVRSLEQMKAVVDKAPTSLQKHYTAWLQDKTGFNFSDADEAEKIVQLAVTLYHDFQASPERAEQKALEAVNRPVKAPSKVKQELASKDAKIAELQAQLAAAQATPATRAPAKRTVAKTDAK